MEEFALHKDNLEAYEAVKKGFETGNRVSILKATGTGKTFVALQLAKDNPGKRILYIVPKLSIKEHVESLLDEYNLGNATNIDFITYQGLVNISTKELEKLRQYDYAIVDEFHHVEAPIWRQRIEALMEENEKTKFLGMSAYSVRNKGTKYAFDVAADIDEEDLEGEEIPLFANTCVYSYNLAQALTDGVLKMPKYIFSEIKIIEYIKEISEEIEQIQNEELRKKYREEFNSISGSSQLASLKAETIESSVSKDLLLSQLKDGDKAIYFVTRGMIDDEYVMDKTIKELKTLFPNATIYSTSSKMKDGGKQARLDFYNDNSEKLKIMVAIDQYNEGVHAKGVNKVVLGRGTESDIVFFEQVGRALDASDKDKQPVIIDLAGNLDFIMELSDEITFLKEQKGLLKPSGHTLNRNAILSDFGVDFRYVNFLERLNDYFRDIKSANWDYKFEKFKEFLEDNGRYPNQKSTNEEEKKLGVWVIAQRILLKTKKDEELTEDEKYRKDKLNSINFIWDPRSEQWEENYNNFIEFINRNNGKYPKRDSSNEEERSLAVWVRRQRQLRKTKTDKELTEDEKYRINKLNGIKFVWDPFKQQWEENYNNLIEFINRNNGKYPKGGSSNEEEKKLGVWVIAQRILLKTKKDEELTEDEKYRKDKLNSINFIWDQISEQWEENYNNLIEFINRNNGKYPKSTSSNEEEKKLSAWVNRQRVFFNSKKDEELTEDEKYRKDKLNSINFIWDPRSEQWEENYNNFIEFMNRNNGKYPSSVSTNKEEKKLSAWVNSQRLYFKSKKDEELTEEEKYRKDKLNSINFIWAPRQKNIFENENGFINVDAKKVTSPTKKKKKSSDEDPTFGE